MPGTAKCEKVGRLRRTAASDGRIGARLARSLSIEDHASLTATLAAELICIHYSDFDRENAELSLRVAPPAGSSNAAVKEQHWLWYNFCRHRVASISKAMTDEISLADARELLGWIDASIDMRNAIVALNRGLSYHVVKKTPTTLDPDDAVAEADFALIRSVEYFDVRRGVRFSSYACRAMMNRIRRASKPARASDGLEGDNLSLDEEERSLPDDVRTMRRALRENIAGLTPLEHRVLKLRFGLDQSCNVRRGNDWFCGSRVWHVGDAGEEEPRSVASRAGLTLVGLGEVEQRALTKLRAALA